MILKTHRFSDCIIYWYETCTRTWYCMLHDAAGNQLNHCCPDAYHKEDILDICADMQANPKEYADALDNLGFPRVVSKDNAFFGW